LGLLEMLQEGVLDCYVCDLLEGDALGRCQHSAALHVVFVHLQDLLR
jgi:hypothetical protein